MKYDKIRGQSVSECMMKLRSRYGSSAIILSTREVKEGGILGSGLFSKKMYEIDFMIEEKNVRRSSDISEMPAAAENRREPARHIAGESSQGARGDSGRPRTIRPVKFQQIQREIGQAHPGQDTVGAPTKVPAPRMLPAMGRPTSQATEDGEALLKLISGEEGADEARMARDILADFSREHGSDTGTLAGANGGTNAGAMNVSEARPAPEEAVGMENPSQATGMAEMDDSVSKHFLRIRNRLAGSQVSSDFIDTFLLNLDHSLSRKEKREYRRIEERSLEQLAEMIRTVPDVAPPRGECRAVMLMGPTGMGKTTSLAKLAARYHIFENRDVSLYSLDHYRLAATEQLKTYANVMGLEFNAPLNPEEFRESLRRDGAELMLIDTSGISHTDGARLEELARFVQACEVRLEKHLVLAANTSPALVEKILLAYDAVGFDKIILTKLDESDFIGAFIENADKFNRPFSFLMNGQDVPGDIMEPHPLDMARMCLFRGEQ